MLVGRISRRSAGIDDFRQPRCFDFGIDVGSYARGPPLWDVVVGCVTGCVGDGGACVADWRAAGAGAV